MGGGVVHWATSCTPDHLLDEFDPLHLARPNKSRLRTSLSKSRLFIKTRKVDGYRLSARSIRDLDAKYGQAGDADTVKAGTTAYVNEDRIAELKALAATPFDLRRLVKMCTELNSCRQTGCELAVAYLIRSILDHVPPILGKSSFGEVANNYGGSKSFRESMANLENSSRKISDGLLHTQIRKRESLPTMTQVDFSNDLDVLLSEIVRVLV